MKRNLIGILPLVVMSLMVGVTSSYAQTAVKANVPFAFKVGSKELPAGTYTVGRATDSAVMIRNGQTKAGALSNIRYEHPRDGSPKLVFHRFGDQYFLAEIWRDAGSSGMVIPESKLEKSLRKELRAAGGTSNVGEEVMVALN